MIDERIMDKVIKDSIKKEKVSKKIDDNIEQLINNLPNKKSNYNLYIKRSISAAVIVVVLIVSSPIIFPTYAKDIPVLKSILTYYEKYGVISENFEKYAENIDEKASDNGITITLEKVVGDNYGLRFAYKVETERENVDIYEMIQSRININGKEYPGRMSEGNTYKIDEKSTYFITTYPIEGLSNNLDIQWKIKNIYGVDGNWVLKTKVDLNEIEKESKSLDINDSFNVDNRKVSIDKLTRSPLQTIISGTLENDDSAKNDNNWHPVLWVLDENGVKLDSRLGMGKSDNEPYKWQITVNGNVKSNNLQLVYVDAFYQDDDKSKKVSIEEINNKVLYNGELGYFKVNNAVEKEDKFEVNVIVDGVYKEFLANCLEFKEKNNKNYGVGVSLSFEDTKKLQNAKSKIEVTLEYNKSNKNALYDIYLRNPDEIYKMHLDKKYIIKL